MSSPSSSFEGSISDPECPICTSPFDYEHLPLRFAGCSHRLCSLCVPPLLEAEELVLGVECAIRCPLCRSGEDRRDMEVDWAFLNSVTRCADCRDFLSPLHLVCSSEGCDRAGQPLCYGCAATSHREHGCKTNEHVQAEKRKARIIHDMKHLPIESLQRFVDEESLKLHIRERLLDLMSEYKYKNARKLADALLPMANGDLISIMREDVVLRKLTADGDGCGDERRIAQVLQVLRAAHRGKATKADAIKALRSLDTIELNAEKQRHVTEMMARQKEEFTEQQRQIEFEIAQSATKMEEAKKALVEAKQIRRNRVEYNLLVKMIEDVPSRADTQRKLHEIAEELKAHAERQQVLEAKLAERRNHLHAFNIILSNFQNFIEEDDAMDEGGAAETDEINGDKEKEKKRETKPPKAEPLDEGEVR